MSEKKQRLEDLEVEFSGLRARRSELYDNMKQWQEKRNSLNESVRRAREDAAKHRGRRDKINDQVAELKEGLQPFYKKLDKKRKELRVLESGKKKKIDGLPPRRKVVQQLKRIEWKLMTTPTRAMMDKEDQYIGRADELKQMLEQYEALDNKSDKDADLLADVNTLNKQIDEIRDQMSILAAESQNHHENMIALYEKADGERAKANEAHAKFVDNLEEVKKVNTNMDQIMSEIKELRDELDIKKRKRLLRRRSGDRAKIEELRKEAQRKLEAGEKLTFEEMRVLYGNQR